MTEESPGVRVVLVLRDGFNHIVEGLDQILADLAPEGVGIPQIDLAELDAADWTSYRTKGPAQPGESAWLKNPAHFTSYEAPPVVVELVKALARIKPKALQLGDMEYRFTGEGKFISRRPAKKERAK